LRRGRPPTPRSTHATNPLHPGSNGLDLNESLAFEARLPGPLLRKSTWMIRNGHSETILPFGGEPSPWPCFASCEAVNTDRNSSHHPIGIAFHLLNLLKAVSSPEKTPLGVLMKESRSSPGPLKQTPIPISPAIEKIGLLTSRKNWGPCFTSPKNSGGPVKFFPLLSPVRRS
jgi:hypothetical protein